MMLVAQQRPQPFVPIRQMHHHPGRGEANQRAGPRDDAGVERRHVFQVVHAAQPEHAPCRDDPVRVDARGQPLARPQRRHFDSGVAPPSDRVVVPRVERKRVLRRLRDPGVHPPAGRQAPDVPGGRTPLVVGESPQPCRAHIRGSPAGRPSRTFRVIFRPSPSLL